MTTAEVTVRNKTGLHARPAATFASTAARFKADVKVKNLARNSAEVSAKSPVRILTLAISQGTQIQISADGEDEKEAVSTLTALVNEGFGEL